MSDPNDFLDREGFADPTALPPKYLHAGESYDKQPHIYLDEDGVSVVANRKNLISVDDDFGVMLAGDLSLSAMPDQISYGGGYFRMNPLTASTVPSTTPTPIPFLIKSTPKLLAGLDSLSGLLSSLQSNLGV